MRDTYLVGNLRFPPPPQCTASIFEPAHFLRFHLVRPVTQKCFQRRMKKQLEASARFQQTDPAVIACVLVGAFPLAILVHSRGPR